MMLRAFMYIDRCRQEFIINLFIFWTQLTRKYNKKIWKLKMFFQIQITLDYFRYKYIKGAYQYHSRLFHY